MTATTHRSWLRRLSDYHSGGVADTERAAVEVHLASCSECQEALAMYHRFYALARSPLRLGGPSYAFQGSDTLPEATTVRTPATMTPRSPGPPPGPRMPGPRSRALMGIAAVVVVALVATGFVVALATRGRAPATAAPSPTATHAATANATASAASTPQATAIPTPGQFVCANPQGSSLTYAYVRGDGNLYAVTGCGQPRPLVTGNRYPVPVAWSPSNHYLAVDISSSQGPGDAIVIVNAQTGQNVATPYMLAGIGIAGNLNPGQTAKLFLGWLNDDLFVAADVPLLDGATGSNTGPATIVTVDRTTQKETKVGTVTWFADAKVRAGRYLFYAGYQSKSEGGAYLHRLDMITGQDSKGVPLGLAGPGPCQGTPYCNWTAPWDVTADGSHILWHKPGPAGPPSDTYEPPDTPLVYSNWDGTNATQPFGSELADGMTSPVLSPDGAYLAAWGVHAAGKPAGQLPFVTIVHVGGGTPVQVTASGFVWRADSAALVVDTGTTIAVRQLYTLGGTGNITLEENSGNYLWGN